MLRDTSNLDLILLDSLKTYLLLICINISRFLIVTDLSIITDSISTKSTTAAKRSVPTDAPMLNYIFDAHSTLNKHQHHHDHRWGPHFEGESKNMTVQAGGSALLDCRISLLQDKTVSLFLP